VSAGSFDSEQRAQWQSAQQALVAAEAQVSAIQADAARYQPTAPFAGVLRDIEPEARPGTWLSPQEPLARLIADQGLVAVTYFDADELGRIAVGDEARFYSDAPGGPVVRLRVANIDADASHALPDPELSTLFGGSLVVREKAGQFYPERPVYRVTLKAASTDAVACEHAWRGKVVVDGRWAAPASHYLRSAAGLIRREAGF